MMHKEIGQTATRINYAGTTTMTKRKIGQETKTRTGGTEGTDLGLRE